MQCPSCAFENMPGLTACGRCGARLVAAAGESFLPAAAGPGRRLRERLGRVARLAGLGPGRPARPQPGRARSAWREAATGVREVLRELVNPDWTVPVWKDSPVLAGLLSFAPGLGHLYLRRWRRGLPMLLSGAVSLYVAARYYGTWVGAWAMGGYAMLVAAAVMQVAFFGTRGGRLARFLKSLGLVLLIWLLALPAVAGLNAAWQIRYVQLDRAVGPFREDELVAFDTGALADRDPALGEIVLTRRGTINVVLAGPGDVAEWQDGGLHLNGAARPDLRPLDVREILPFRIDVPADRYLILPEGRGRGMLADYRGFVQLFGLVKREDVLGLLVGEQGRIQ